MRPRCFSKAKERGRQHAVMAEAHRGCSERLACRGQVGHDHPADFRLYLLERCVHRQADETGQVGVRIHYRHDLDPPLQCADGRDLGQIRNTGECDMFPAARFRDRQHLTTVGPRPAEEGKRVGEIIDGQA